MSLSNVRQGLTLPHYVKDAQALLSPDNNKTKGTQRSDNTLCMRRVQGRLAYFFKYFN